MNKKEMLQHVNVVHKNMGEQTTRGVPNYPPLMSIDELNKCNELLKLSKLLPRITKVYIHPETDVTKLKVSKIKNEFVRIAAKNMISVPIYESINIEKNKIIFITIINSVEYPIQEEIK